MTEEFSQPLTAAERERYAWQLRVADFGEFGQQRLRSATVLISRVGGLGGLVAYQLAAAGVGRLVLAHAGKLEPGDLNRQLLMSHARLGESRVETARARLLELNPTIEVEAMDANVSDENAAELVGRVDLVVDCAPIFAERYAMHRAAVAERKPIVECAMFDLEAQITTMIPGRTPCLACLYTEPPINWSRQFPVFGAVSGSLGCIAAMEAIKLLAGFGRTLLNRLLIYDLREMRFRQVAIQRRADCPVCGHLA